MAPTPLPSCTEVLASSKAQADGPEGLRSLGTILPTGTGETETQNEQEAHAERKKEKKTESQ